jgi:hypothetical protein
MNEDEMLTLKFDDEITFTRATDLLHSGWEARDFLMYKQSLAIIRSLSEKSNTSSVPEDHMYVLSVDMHQLIALSAMTSAAIAFSTRDAHNINRCMKILNKYFEETQEVYRLIQELVRQCDEVTQ